jgi:hypothetical protein
MTIAGKGGLGGGAAKIKNASGVGEVGLPYRCGDAGEGEGGSVFAEIG